jgi:hypothetical protein
MEEAEAGGKLNEARSSLKPEILCGSATTLSQVPLPCAAWNGVHSAS